MAHWVCYYHVVWATKERRAWITPLNEHLILTSIEQQSTKLKCPLVALNAVSDHVHAAVRIPPSLSVAQWVSKVKGYSSRVINETYPDMPFQWQEGYGVYTFGAPLGVSSAALPLDTSPGARHSSAALRQSMIARVLCASYPCPAIHQRCARRIPDYRTSLGWASRNESRRFHASAAPSLTGSVPG